VGAIADAPVTFVRVALVLGCRMCACDLAALSQARLSRALKICGVTYATHMVFAYVWVLIQSTLVLLSVWGVAISLGCYCIYIRGRIRCDPL
jgi:hypothetical protein